MHDMPADSTAAPDLMMIGPLGISSDRQGSGTTWVPEAVQMPARHVLLGGWAVMSHWNVFGQYITQRGRRGDDQFGSINWVMLMASRPLLGGRFQLRAMNSVDAATVGRCGYPHLLQTGETCHGFPIPDRQHPHDFFMEVGALYERAFSRSVAWSIYAAPSGEPALGPVAFMHRPSAMNDPMSNITHHWQDATHVTFGVVSGAVYGRTWKLEASAFNGREPDENRWNFDLDGARLSSHAGRVTIHPSDHWSASASLGRVVGMSDMHGTILRAHSSLMYGGSMLGRPLAMTFVWGANRHESAPGHAEHVGGGHWQHSALLEADYLLTAKTSVFGRAEWVKKSAEELGVASPPESALGALGLGVLREIGSVSMFGIGAGARVNIGMVPDALIPNYGQPYPTGLVLFLRVRAKPMTEAELEQVHERMRHAGMKMD